MSLRNIKPGHVLTARELRDAAREAASTQPAASFGASGSTMQTPGGTGSVSQMSDWFPVRITGTVTGGYSVVERWIDDTGTSADKVGGRQNDSNAPAVSLRGITFATNDVALCRLGPGAGGMKWELIARDFTQTLLTVVESDGSPSVASVTSLQFDQTDGFVVSTPGAGTAKVNIAPASASQIGVVTITSQTFAGLKTFQDGAVNQGTGIKLGDASYAFPTADLTAPAPYAATKPPTGQGFLSVSDGTRINLFGSRSNTTGGVTFQEVWLETSVNLIGNIPGVFVLVGNYAVYSAASGNVHVGITATKTVKDGTGTNQTVTIQGGIITGWT